MDHCDFCHRLQPSGFDCLPDVTDQGNECLDCILGRLTVRLSLASSVEEVGDYRQEHLHCPSHDCKLMRTKRAWRQNGSKLARVVAVICNKDSS